MTNSNYISLKDLQGQIKTCLERGFAFPLWVACEIGELKVNNYSGHCYMELIEKGGSNGVPSAKASAVIWRSNYGSISSYFRSETGSDLAVGMQVLLKVSVTFHELYGMSLQVSDINPSFTLGDLARQRQKTIEQLQHDGIFDMNKELEFPIPLQRIAVISSKTAAGFQDFSKELDVSDYKIQVTLFEAFMQGSGAENSIISALDLIASREDEFDAVVIIRGGGSQSDLSCFNSYELCSAIAQFPLPIIAGIGHDKDQSVVDLVAKLSLKTPTAVAGYLVEKMAELDYFLSELTNNILTKSQDIITQKKQNLDKQIFSISRLSDRLTQGVKLKILNLENSIFNTSKALLAKEKAKAEKYEAQIISLNPEKILSLGFSIVRHKGKLVNDSTKLEKGNEIKITMSQGEISAVVKE